MTPTAFHSQTLADVASNQIVAIFKQESQSKSATMDVANSKLMRINLHESTSGFRYENAIGSVTMMYVDVRC